MDRYFEPLGLAFDERQTWNTPDGLNTIKSPEIPLVNKLGARITSLSATFQIKWQRSKNSTRSTRLVQIE